MKLPMQHWIWSFGLLCGLIGGPVGAEEHFLTIGGGYSPSGNQVSLEKNILYFKSLLGENNLSNHPHHVIFADGPKPGRSVQFSDPNHRIPEINLLLARLVGSTKGLNHQYRKHRIPNVQGVSSAESIDRWFTSVGHKLKAGDRVVIYFTGHGGKASSSKSQNTKMYLWNGKSMYMTDFVKKLDKLDPKVQVVVVMVQCYSGGFANLVFKEGDAKKGVAPHNRVGFYATVHNRLAAGCTPDINEANYQEYSTYFWAGLFGKTRLGEPVVTSDYNSDGRVGYDEAHAYALINSNTIDISIKTSGAFLRQYASTKKDSKHPNRLSAASPYSKLLAVSTPSERATLEALSRSLGLGGENRAAATGKLAAKLKSEMDKAKRDKKLKDSQYRKIRASMGAAVKNRWPELANPLHPEASKIMAAEGPQIVAYIKRLRPYKSLNDLWGKMQADAKRASTAERKWVKTQRVLRTLENVALAANLSQEATPAIKARYKQLIDAEAATFLAKPQQQVQNR